jgi:hypothetical protein
VGDDPAAGDRAASTSPIAAWAFPDQVERLKYFTRASAARAAASGVAGAGLGLAIVERIARMHGGTLDLLPREGGGTIARVKMGSGPINGGEYRARGWTETRR